MASRPSALWKAPNKDEMDENIMNWALLVPLYLDTLSTAGKRESGVCDD